MDNDRSRRYYPRMGPRMIRNLPIRSYAPGSVALDRAIEALVAEASLYQVTNDRQSAIRAAYFLRKAMLNAMPSGRSDMAFGIRLS